MASQHAFNGQRATAPPAELDHGLSRVLRAAWAKSARAAKERRTPLLVAAQQSFHNALALCDLGDGVHQLLKSFWPPHCQPSPDAVRVGCFAVLALERRRHFVR